MSGTGKATKKKSSNSGGAKKAMGDRRSEQSETALGFFGAGGHVKISGILCLSAFGVLQPPSEHSSPNSTMSFCVTGTGISIFCGGCFLFVVFLIFFVSFKLGKALLVVLVAILAPEGAIFEGKTEEFRVRRKTKGFTRKI